MKEFIVCLTEFTVMARDEEDAYKKAVSRADRMSGRELVCEIIPNTDEDYEETVYDR